jgi:hypothetical protein
MDTENRPSRVESLSVKGLFFLAITVLTVLAALAGASGAWLAEPSVYTTAPSGGSLDVLAQEIDELEVGLAPFQPSNVEPADSATEQSLNPTLRSSAFSDNDTGDTHAASQWQMTATSGNYTEAVFDSATDNVNLTEIAVPAGILSDNAPYYWHVRYLDSQDEWSDWSAETSFTTLNHAPSQPTNESPSDNATETRSPTLQSSAFSDNDTGDTHASSEWQITAVSENYTDPVFDTTDNVNLTEIVVPGDILGDNATYYWRVRHQDNHEAWSEWSSQTSFITLNDAPNRPSNESPSENATEVSLNPTLQSSAFSDNDTADTHTSSQWQITATSENYTAPVFDSTTDNVDLTEIVVPGDILSDDTVYYWRVRHQDNHEAWSDWSSETWFRTFNHSPSQPATLSPENGADVTVTVTLESSPFSDGDANDTHGASRWQITATAGNYTSTLVDEITLSDAELTSRSVFAGVLSPGNTYYWHVRHQDNHGAWSEWSAESSFTTVNSPPDKPDDLSPESGAIGISLVTKLESPFSDPDGASDYRASQWQITTTSGDYSSPIYYYTSDAASIRVPEGLLSNATTYYWRVRHQDKQGVWSEWSDEASFTTMGEIPSGDEGGGLPFWAWILIGLGSAAAVAAVVVVVWQRRRAQQAAAQRRRKGRK